MRKGFDNKKYLKVQSKKIKERFDLFDKLYLEIGGKLFDDHHAARVLPGFEPDSKLKLLLEYANSSRDIADPWYTGNFNNTKNDVIEGCRAFLNYLKENELS